MHDVGWALWVTLLVALVIVFFFPGVFKVD